MLNVSRNWFDKSEAYEDGLRNDIEVEWGIILHV